MLTQLDITNFRGIQEANLKGLTPLTILVGPSGSGKSTLLEAMYVLNHAQPMNALNEMMDRRVTKNAARWLMRNRNPDTSATIASNDYGLTLERSAQEPGDQSGRSYRFSLKVTDSPVVGEMAATVGGGGSYSNMKVPNRPEMCFWYVNNRNNFSPLDLFSQIFRSGRKRAMLELLRPLLGPQFEDISIVTEPTNQSEVHILFSWGSVPVELAGDGVAAAVKLALMLSAADGGLALLEDPETHQHPRAMRQTSAVIWAAISRGIQVILTTHSLELIDDLLDLAPDDQIHKLSVIRVALRDGILAKSQFEGEQVRDARRELEAELR